MSFKVKFWSAAAAFYGTPTVCIATPKSAPAWILYVEDGLMLLWSIPAGLLVLCILAVLVTPSRVSDRAVVSLVERFERRRKPVVREVHKSNGIQVLSTFLRSGEEGDQ